MENLTLTQDPLSLSVTLLEVPPRSTDGIAAMMLTTATESSETIKIVREK